MIRWLRSRRNKRVLELKREMIRILVAQSKWHIDAAQVYQCFVWLKSSSSLAKLLRRSIQRDLTRRNIFRRLLTVRSAQLLKIIFLIGLTERRKRDTLHQRLDAEAEKRRRVMMLFIDQRPANVRPGEQVTRCADRNAHQVRCAFPFSSKDGL